MEKRCEGKGKLGETEARADDVNSHNTINQSQHNTLNEFNLYKKDLR